MSKLIEKLKGKKRYILFLMLAAYDLLKAFEVLETNQQQDVSVYIFLLALLGIEAGIKARLVNKFKK